MPVALSRVEELGSNKKYKEAVHKYQTLLRYDQLATTYQGNLQEIEVLIHPSWRTKPKFQMKHNFLNIWYRTRSLAQVVKDRRLPKDNQLEKS